MASNGKDTEDISALHHWVRESRDSGRNSDLNDQTESGRSVTTQKLNSKNSTKSFMKIQKFI